MNDMMTTREFNQLLHMAVQKYSLDPSKTYIECTWWDKVFKPFTITDCNWEKSEFIIVFGDTPCNTFHDGVVIPAGFWVFSNAVYIEQVVHRPMTASEIIDNEFMLQFDNVKFMFASSPVNYRIDINPYKTCVYKNRANETILALHVEDRDGGEWQPFSSMTSDSIKLVDDSI